MSKKDMIAVGFIIWAVVFGVFALKKRSEAKSYQQQAFQSQAKLDSMSKKSINLIDETGKGVIYLAPKGITASKNSNSAYITDLLKKTFIYNSPEEFKKQAEYVRPRVTGEFYDYWLKNGIEANYQNIKGQAQGRKSKRFAKEITVTEFDNKHFMAFIQTGVAIGDTNPDDIQPDVFVLDITKRKDGKWQFNRVPNAQPYLASDADNPDASGGHTNSDNSN